MATTQAQAQQPQMALVPPSFGLPGGSLDLYAPDTTNGTVVTLNETASVSQQLQPLQNTDVIANWQLQNTFAVTPPTGATASPNLPFVGIQNVTLNVQNVFQPLNTTGVDLAIKQLVFPHRETNRFPSNATPNSAAYPTNVESQSFGPGTYVNTSASLAWSDFLDLGPSQHFDHYYEVDLASGLPVMTNGVLSQRIYAGVQYLGGTTRQIIPSITFNPLFGTNPQQAFYTGTETAAGSGTATLTIYREGWFSNTNPAMMPAVTNWVPTFTTNFYNIGATPNWTFELPKSLQVLGLVFRFYDPSTGLTPAVTNVTSMQLQVGSGIILYNGDGQTAQKRLYQTLGLAANAIPGGTIVIDRMHNNRGETTNQAAINTYTTNGAITKFNFNAIGSSEFGCYVSAYGLQYVDQGSGI